MTFAIHFYASIIIHHHFFASIPIYSFAVPRSALITFYLLNTPFVTSCPPCLEYSSHIALSFIKRVAATLPYITNHNSARPSILTPTNFQRIQIHLFSRSFLLVSAPRPQSQKPSYTSAPRPILLYFQLLSMHTETVFSGYIMHSTNVSAVHRRLSLKFDRFYGHSF